MTDFGLSRNEFVLLVTDLVLFCPVSGQEFCEALTVAVITQSFLKMFSSIFSNHLQRPC